MDGVWDNSLPMQTALIGRSTCQAHVSAVNYQPEDFVATGSPSAHVLVLFCMNYTSVKCLIYLGFSQSTLAWAFRRRWSAHFMSSFDGARIMVNVRDVENVINPPLLRSGFASRCRIRCVAFLYARRWEMSIRGKSLHVLPIGRYLGITQPPNGCCLLLGNSRHVGYRTMMDVQNMLSADPDLAIRSLFPLCLRSNDLCRFLRGFFLPYHVIYGGNS